MNRMLLVPVAGAVALIALGAIAAEKFPPTKVGLEKCMAAATKEKAGTVVKVEMKMERNVPTYEFDIESTDGKAWDIECDGNTGKITEIEEEVPDASHAKFAGKMKVTLEEARKTVLDKHKGEITEIEYEIEPDGAASYEIDVLMADGNERKVEVDATTGKIVEDNLEIDQIGKED
jgi:uncharacterized membrane protein YkoI